eukprot:scaffold196678_cov17-Tisochrysis_lutea.AAC.1
MDVVKRVSMAALESSGMNLPLEALDPYIRDNFAQTQQTNATDYRAPPDASLSTWSEILRYVPKGGSYFPTSNGASSMVCKQGACVSPLGVGRQLLPCRQCCTSSEEDF